MPKFDLAQRIAQSIQTGLSSRASRWVALLSLGFISMQSAQPALAMNRQVAIQLAMASAVPLPRAFGSQLEEGIHFFGEADAPNQLGSTYIVFEVKDAEVLGAVYAPNSAYSCFEGRFSGNQLALRIDDPYGDEVYLHEIALEQQATAIAAGEELASVQMEMGLAGMTALGEIRAEEQSLLASCKAEL